MSHHGPHHPLKDAGAVADSLTHPQWGAEVALRCQKDLRTQELIGITTGNNPED
jgi:hypothetical protein